MKPQLAFALAALLGSSALQAADAQLTVQIPRLDVAEYHRPYVAIWLENDAGHVSDLTVWYDTEMRDDEGEKWLKDLRQWWRRSGRGLDLPVDGISAATRPPGTHELALQDLPAFKELAPGDYELVVEAAREVGGRELLKVPFSWPVSQAADLQAQGSRELGQIRLQLTP